MTLVYSSGQVEGAVNKIKVLSTCHLLTEQGQQFPQ
jgi:hypothetical protein